MTITVSQRKKFFNDGYLVIENAVAPELIRDAMRAINASLGNGMDPAEMPTLRARTFCPELRDAQVISALTYESGVLDTAAEMVGDRLVSHGSKVSQIALRFPRNDFDSGIEPHIDGMYSPDNGVPKGQIISFTILVGIVLADVTEENSGNLTVWPGSHRKLERYFAEEGPQSLLNGMPPLDWGEPTQITARAGDVILAHYQLAHTVGPHHGPLIRYMTFNRMETATHQKHKWEAMTNIWLEWPAMQRQ